MTNQFDESYDHRDKLPRDSPEYQRDSARDVLFIYVGSDARTHRLSTGTTSERSFPARRSFERRVSRGGRRDPV